ncbi:hypothetical protein FB566_1864 [Stackebrandtia endophytica]|uniref:DUF3558 domain-containing protein n=1 Tax=Stackebrandtia endophytica TaxID=1496996 RepID=A0A543AUW0_9ACTN|nr:hypothetical protein [Stackebrandtia endophytica]TQL76337.1 hypothetical protein FB566_1864 [Stackebrandtia endophytica]
MTKSPKREGRRALRYLKNGWTILSTAVVVLIAGALVYALLGLDRFFEEEYVPPPPGPSTPGSYSTDHVDGPCEELDLSLYESTTGQAADTISGDFSCSVLSDSDGVGPTSHHIRITVSAWDDIETATAVFDSQVDRELDEADRTTVEGPWKTATMGTNEHGDLVLIVHDENFQLEIVQTMNPPDLLSPEETRDLLTAYAEQVLDAYRA